MLRFIKRALFRWWLRRKFAPSIIGTPQEIDAWIERVVQDRVP